MLEATALGLAFLRAAGRILLAAGLSLLCHLTCPKATRTLMLLDPGSSALKATSQYIQQDDDAKQVVLPTAMHNHKVSHWRLAQSTNSVHHVQPLTTLTRMAASTWQRATAAPTTSTCTEVSHKAHVGQHPQNLIII